MKLNNLKKVKINGESLKITIILPYFNDKLGLKLLESAQKELLNNGVKEKNIKLIRVAGCLEIQFACQKIAEKYKPSAIIALGVIIRGETKHFDLVAENTYSGIMKVQLEKKIPVSFGIIACENEKQAMIRVDKNKLNKGKDFAIATLLQTTI